MTVDEPKRYFLQDYYIFFSVPLCAAFGMLQFGDIFKAAGITLFVCAFCIIYKLYDRYTRAALDNKKSGIKQEIFSVSGFIFTVCVAVFSDISMFRWLFLIGILLSVFFSGIISSFMSVFAYVLITTIFTEATPEYVAKSLLTAVILIILTRYYSDFVSLVYSIICLLSFEAAFFLILHGMDMEMLFSLYYLKEALIITICVIIGWLMFKQINSTSDGVDAALTASKENETSETKDKEDEAINAGAATDSAAITKTDSAETAEIKEVLSEAATEEYAKEDVTTAIEKSSTLKEAVETEHVGVSLIDKEPEDRDYSYLLSKNNSAYRLLVGNEGLFNKALRTSKLVKDITELIEGRVSLAEVGGFFAECGRAVSNNYIKEGLILAKENNFPIEVTDFIKEHNFKLGYPRSRETAITMIVCKLGSTVDFLEEKGVKRSITAIVDSVMDSCLMAGRLDASGLSLNEYKFIKDYLLEEARVRYDYFSGERS